MFFNLQRLTRSFGKAVAKGWKDPTEAQLEQNNDIFEWTVRQMRLFYPQEEIDKVLTNRRSDFSDEALIADFMTFEHLSHPIPRDGNFNRGLRKCEEMFRPHRVLHPVSYPDLRYYPWNLTTNVEAPWNVPNFRFNPKDRNIDLEAETTRVTNDKALQWKHLFIHFEEWRMKNLMNWLSNPENGEQPDGMITVPEWLRMKQKFGLIEDVRVIKHNLYDEVTYYNRTLIHQIKDGDEPFWNDGKPISYGKHTLHARSHVVAADEPDKIRAVFGAPWLVLHAELMFVWTLYAEYQNHEENSPLLWNHETMRGGVKKLIREAHQKTPYHQTILTSDWSQFDKRLLFELMKEVFSIWRSYYDFSSYEETSQYYGDQSKIDDPFRIERLWHWMTMAILNTPIILPNGETYRWTHNGFGSGFMMTQLLDSFCNAIMLLTCLAALGIKIEDDTFWMLVQGDDSIIAFCEYVYGPGFLDKLAESAKYYFNAKLSTKKSHCSNSFQDHSILGYIIKNQMPYRTDEDLLRHLLFPETQKNSWNRQISVFIGLAYASCGMNEKFFDFAEYCYKRLQEKGDVPERKYLMWMQRAGIIDIEDLTLDLFPRRIDLVSNLWFPAPRTDKMRQRVWPTREGPRGGFYFLHD